MLSSDRFPVVSELHESNAVRPIIGDAPAPGIRSTGAAVLPPGVEQLREIFQHAMGMLRRRRRVFYTVFGSVTALLSLTILSQATLYEATALMLVKVGREVVPQADVGAEQSFAERDRTSVINSELAILRSQPVLLGVVREIGLDVLFPDLSEGLILARAARVDASEESREEQILMARAAEMVKAGLSTQALPDADVLQVSFQHSDPIVAAQAVNALVDRFLEAHLSAFAEPEIVNFLAQRVDAIEERLRESESSLGEFETAHAAFALEAPQSVLLESRSELRTELDTIETQMTEIRLRLLQDDASVTEARSTLLQLKVEASRLKGRPRSDLLGRAAVVEQFIEKRKAVVNEELLIMEEKRLASLQRLDATEAELAQLPSLAAEHRRLVRERDAEEEQYSTYMRRLRNARLSGEMDQERIASINVIQPALPPPAPVWPPKKAPSFALALILALIAAGAVVTLWERAPAAHGRAPAAHGRAPAAHGR
jgi:uncharacterized protein involved in exopolysaccharide biosynthesis